jgi:alginate O-acetyltransferase complex protein AlgI
VFTREVFTIVVIAVVVIYGSVKAVALVRGPVPASGALALFLTIWPGVRTEPFTLRQRPDPDGLRVVAQGAATALLGLACWVALAHAAAGLPRGVVGWLGVFVVLLTLHLGLSDVVSGGLRWAGYPVRRLFRSPLASRSLREFWSSRWNSAFVEMNQVIIMPVLRRRLGRWAVPATFLVSGLLHEVAISLPGGQGFGRPTLYFALHAAATVGERRIGVHRWPGWLARLWTWALVLVPLPLLFHSAFRDALILPMFGVTR